MAARSDSGRTRLEPHPPCTGCTCESHPMCEDRGPPGHAEEARRHRGLPLGRASTALEESARFVVQYGRRSVLAHAEWEPAVVARRHRALLAQTVESMQGDPADDQVRGGSPRHTETNATPVSPERLDRVVGRGHPCDPPRPAGARLEGGHLEGEPQADHRLHGPATAQLQRPAVYGATAHRRSPLRPLLRIDQEVPHDRGRGFDIRSDPRTLHGFVPERAGSGADLLGSDPTRSSGNGDTDGSRDGSRGRTAIGRACMGDRPSRRMVARWNSISC